MSSFIPAGKTSSIRRGDSSLQIQTEYACRPSPRITTTVLHDGRVLHKFERKLESIIESLQEQNQIEEIIKRQHIDILSTIRSTPESKPLTIETPGEPSEEPSTHSVPTPPIDGELSIDSSVSDSLSIDPQLSLHERFAQIPGFEHCFQMDNDGQFKSSATESQFRKRFRKAFKSRLDLLEVFPTYESDPTRRESGVYEIERDRLFLISTGDSCLVISINPVGSQTNYEQIIKEASLPSGALDKR
ncbi:MAG: hypothetical protein KOO62_02630 [candidate division Zixibacteria bacterium]|nr:hypothetical protein [candidate division Zixibacteria bacterium]